MAIVLPPTTKVQIVRLTQALFSAAPGNTYLTAFEEYAGTTTASMTTFANWLASLVSTDAATLATTVATNLGLTGDALTAGTAYLTAQFTANPSSYGRVILDAVNAFATLSGNATYGAAADTFNASTSTAYVYSTNTANTSTNLSELQEADVPASATAGQTFTLTAGVDTGAAFTGGSGDDSFVGGTIDTWSAFDKIDGGAGTDSLTATITGTAIPGGATVANIETVSINTTGAGITADVSAWTGLTTANISVSGNGPSVITGADTMALQVSAVGNDDLTVTTGSSATVTNANGDDTWISGITGLVTATGGSEAGDILSINTNKTMTTVAVLDGGIVAIGDGLTALADVTFDDDAVTDVLTTVSIAGNLGASTINSDVLTSLTLASSAQDCTVTAAAATRVLGLSINGLTGGTLTDATATTLNLSSTGTASSGITVVAGAATAVTIDADVKTTIAALTVGGATGLTVKGDSLVTITADTTTVLATINASANSGGLTIGEALNVGLVYTGSTGADTITLGVSTVATATGDGDDVVTAGAAVATTATVNAGGGTADVINFSANGALTSVTGAQFSNFEVLRATAATDIDMDLITGSTITAIQTSGSSTIVDMNATQAAAVTVLATGALDLRIKGSTVPGVSDTLSLTTSTTNTAVTMATLVSAGTETINLTANTGTGTTTISTLAHGDWSTLNLAGAAAITITSTATAAIINTNVNGSTATGVLTLDFALSATNGIGLTGGSGNDALTGTAQGDNIVGGAGNDTIVTGNGVNYATGGTGDDTITGGTGVDTITAGEGADTITGALGIDVIDLTETTSAVDIVSLSGVTAAANRDTITGFTSAKDILKLDLDYTTVATAAAAAAVTQTSAVSLVTAAAFNIAALAATTAKDLYILTGGNETTADLSASTTGTELFKYLGTAGNAATSLTVTGTGNMFFIAAFDAGNTYVYQVTENLDTLGADTAASAADVVLVGTLTGTAAVVAADFVMIA